MSTTSIEWASDTRNYYDWHCDKVSPGCKNCYAEALAKRNHKTFAGAPQWRANVWKEKIKPGHVYFVNSMSDTYHESVPVRWIHAIHNDALLHPEATFLLLTKRIERAFYLSPYLAWPQNLWVGTSVENADYLWRLEYLVQIPAAGRFVSAEPLLGSIRVGLADYLRRGVNWVICGGESGEHRRPFNKDWAREIRDMCQQNDVPFLLKQGSAHKPGYDRELDERTWNENPFDLHKPQHDAVLVRYAPGARAQARRELALSQLEKWNKSVKEYNER